MSTLFTTGNAPSPARRSTCAGDHELSSWPAARLLNWLLTRSEISRQRAALREIADDPHMLRDLGLTRDDALEQANRPPWR